MRCASCGFENRQGAKFCNECGTSLSFHCGACGTENPGGAKYCSECGTSLTKQTASSVRTEPARPSAAPGGAGSGEQQKPEAERRQLTVMFCDLVDSTTLSERLDPEELREVVRAYQQASTEVIARYEGHIAQYLGDGLLIYFGYPVAHEDDAARAVRAGLGIVEVLQTLNPRLSHPVQVRIGIHTGPVVVGEIGGSSKREHLALGETPNIAARLQGLAEPDAVVVSAATARLIAGLFEWEDGGTHTLKGLSAPVQVYRVRKEKTAQSRFEASAQHGLTPLVGRTLEIELLRERWEQAREGEGHVVLLSGEPGIGKSRLVQELKEQVAHDGALQVELRCSPYHQNSAFYPIIEHLQRLLQFQPEDPPAVKLQKLEQTLARYRFPQADTLPLVAALLSLPQPAGYPSLTLSPQRQKQKTLEALVAWVVEEADRQPVYSPWEDLHWADPSTLELLTLLIEQVPTARLYLLLTFRPEFTSPWGTRSHIQQLTLSRLGRSQVGQMVERVTGGKALPSAVLQQLITKTDGVPLFVEELTKTVLESGLLKAEDGRYELTGPLPPLAIPATLQDSLMARLDRLATVKEVAQLGSTLGREFSYDLLKAMSPLDESALQQALAKLVEVELIYRRGLPPQAKYIFKHALIQETAYQSLLKSTRQQLHRQIAQVLAERFPEMKETQPELLAHHYTEAGLIAQAIPYWQQAGQRAIEHSANSEAISHLTKGLELLQTLPDTPERSRQELDLQITLGPALIATRGWASPDTERAYTRAQELCEQIGETPQLFPVLYGLCQAYCTRAEYQRAHELGEQLFTLAQQQQDQALLLVARYMLGMILSYLGEFTRAREHLEQDLALYDSRQHRFLAFLYGQDLGVSCRLFVTLALWHLGYPDQALKTSYEALTLAQELTHPFSLAIALAATGIVHQLRWEEQAAQEQAHALIALGTEQGIPFFLAWGIIWRGWALAVQRQGEEGIAQIRQGLAASRATGAENWQPYFLALLAEAHGKVGRAEEGMDALAEALAVVDKTGERYYEAELYRLKGELLLNAECRLRNAESNTQHPTPDTLVEAEGCFWRAIEIARGQSAKSWELRATTSLARLWQQQGKKDEAHSMLSDIYGWFTEGFDIVDLKEAKALLEELS